MTEASLLQDRATGTEPALAEVLADLLKVDRVSSDDHFFDDLGADSLVMAHFCARVRKRPELPEVSIRDIYRHPTIGSLAAALAEVAPARVEPAAPAPVAAPARASTRQYVVCGALQLLFFLLYAYLAALVAAVGFDWISEASGIAIYPRVVAFSAAVFVAVSAVPILAKWILIGRWKAEQIPIWSLRYVRFWIVKTLVRSNPCALLFIGSPLYNLYLRALGAKIGPDVAIFSRRVPICTDLLTIACSTSTRRSATARSSATRPRCTAASRCRPVSDGTARRRSART